MMLETVQKIIEEVPCISFESYFQEYVMKVQDASIDEEVSFLFRNNFPSANSMIKLINQEVEGM